MWFIWGAGGGGEDEDEDEVSRLLLSSLLLWLQLLERELNAAKSKLLFMLRKLLLRMSLPHWLMNESDSNRGEVLTSKPLRALKGAEVVSEALVEPLVPLRALNVGLVLAEVLVWVDGVPIAPMLHGFVLMLSECRLLLDDVVVDILLLDFDGLIGFSFGLCPLLVAVAIIEDNY